MRLLAALLLIACTSAFADHHLLTRAVPVPQNSQFAIGPWVYENCLPNQNCVDAVLGALDAWDSTYAANRITGWNGYVSQGDCPSYPYPRVAQIGAFNFATIYVCSALAKVSNPANVLAFVDYYDTQSISVNLAFAWHIGPGEPPEGVYDLRSVLAHELGHVLGLAHIPDASGGKCSIDPDRPTMGAYFASGEACARTLNAHDIEHADLFYGSPAAQVTDAQIAGYIGELIAQAGSLDIAAPAIWQAITKAGLPNATVERAMQWPEGSIKAYVRARGWL